MKKTFSLTLALGLCLVTSQVFAHGDVTPQPIDITGLEALKDSTVWVDTNPYSGNPRAVEIGHHAYAQNCARCHGIDAVSGGIAPDLREKLPLGQEGDDIFKERMVNGAIRNGVTYMPKFDGIVSQEGLWAIRSWLETVSVDAPAVAATSAPATTTTIPASTEATPAASATPVTPAPAAAASATSTSTTPAATATTTTSPDVATTVTPSSPAPATAGTPISSM
ncbi:cytochrome c-550 PedF [Thiolinea disciformis]|uniref:cytochrome c-550 PedF n=1 Tax=Thiolinea disciformis TaxID=125614 RepID=UPI0003766343|nr:cytochrome c-550 PedF [Thiolinea disciformis]